MKNKTWLLIFAALTMIMCIVICSITIYVDPYMHYHKPYSDKFYYELDNQRSQNNGITKYFDYDAIITGTSMTENFRTTEADKFFDCNSIKVPFSGATFKEINDNLEIAMETHPNTKYIIRALDLYYFNEDKDYIRTDLGEYPKYLYDNNLFNDVQYLFNRNVLYNRVFKMVKDAKNDDIAGITSFDDYSNWMFAYTFGKTSVLADYDRFSDSKKVENLKEDEKRIIKENVEQNILSLADRYKDTDFYYFLPPYSAAYWGEIKQKGTFEKQFQIVEYALSMIVNHSNIHLFGWTRFDLFDDLNNYKDTIHYGEWINSWILKQMSMESGRLTKSNYKSYVTELRNHYANYDYNSLFDQSDNEADYYVSGLLNKEIFGVKPLHVDSKFIEDVEIKNANAVLNQFDNSDGLICNGAMARDSDSESAEVAMYNGDYCGIKFNMDVSEYRALTFYGKKVADHGCPRVCVYRNNGELIRELALSYSELDSEWHQYALNLDDIYGDVIIIMNGGYIDNTGSANSQYVFSKITLY